MLSFNLVFPIFVLLALGYIIRGCGLIDESASKKLNKIIFTIFFPVSILKNVYDSESTELFDQKLIGYGIISVILCVILLLGAVIIFCKRKESRGVLIQGMFRSNFLIYGMPVAESLFPDGSLKGKAAIMVAIIVCLYNGLAVIILEAMSGKKSNPRKIILNIIKNPLIVGSALGFLFLWLKSKGIFIPPLLYGSLDTLASIATPLALIILGASLNFSSMKGNIYYIIFGVTGKLVFIPLVFIGIGIALGFRDRELAILLAMYATPAAVSSYTMAQQMGADDDLAGQLVVFGTVVSIFTVFMWVALLTHFGFIKTIIL